MLSKHAKEMFTKHKGTTLVGLINKTTKEIILAPCIEPKVYLQINEKGEVRGGYWLDPGLGDNLTPPKEKVKELGLLLTRRDLDKINSLLGQNFVPRFVAKKKELISSHEYLFNQQCKSTKKPDWGGFSVMLDTSGKLNYSFSSSSFNSPPGRKVKRAQLSTDLQDEVKKQCSSCKVEIMLLKENLLPRDVFFKKESSKPNLKPDEVFEPMKKIRSAPEKGS
ncbi:hypothetical protein CAB17_03390 [Legionella sainthelensi]|uniref:Uncharacterized protein n=2 Tax=Legionella sainthelensi TaxID=28087 RepID=A0A2H5FI27_9GAMM|nr:hypothetical protein CAB17_03390 [Legionella sainthelensi]